MKELKTIKEVEDHIYDLEKQIFQLKNTHAFRVGMAIMNFYNKPNKVKFLSAHHFLNDLMAGTKKKSGISSAFSSLTKVFIENPYKVEQTIIVNEFDQKMPSKHYYFLPYIKDKENCLCLGPSMKEGIILTPNNYIELIAFGNFDEIKINLVKLLDLPNWRGFGTYEDIARTNKFINILESNTKIKKTLIHDGNLILFPILLDRVNIFNEVVVEESVVR